MKRTILRWLLLLLIVATIGAAIWYKTRPEPLIVTVQPAATGRVEKTVANTRAGTVQACRRAKLSPSIGGQIIHLPIEEGDQVKEGQLLLELFNNDLKAEMVLAEKEVATARAQAQAACINSQRASREANRVEALAARGAASEEDLDNATTRAKVTAAECQAAKGAVISSQARVEVIDARLARTRLTAPFTGTIAEINGELSEYVTPSPIGVVTPPAVDLIDTSCFYVTAPIDEVDAAGVRVGMNARIHLDAFGDTRFPGKVQRIADYVLDREKQARTVDVEVRFTRPEDLVEMLAGYSADVEILLEVRENALRIPTEAVIDGHEVYMYLDQEQQLIKKTIETGLTNWDFSEVRSGINEGELVVVGGDRSRFGDNVAATVVKEDK